MNQFLITSPPNIANGSYPSFFGRVSSSINAANAETAVALADYYEVQITIAAEIARTYIELRGAQYPLDIANRNAANQTKTLKLIKDLEAAVLPQDWKLRKQQLNSN